MKVIPRMIYLAKPNKDAPNQIKFEKSINQMWQRGSHEHDSSKP
jgi:hypothetical protein